MAGRLIILGCGGSAGVPTIGNYWGACDPAEPRNMRTRPSIAIQTETSLLIVDAGPDFQAQMNRENLGTPDAIIITHDHADHINGLDELRTLQRLKKKKFPLHAFKDTLQSLDRRLGYMFKVSENGFYPAVCEPAVVTPGTALTIGDITVLPFTQGHGDIVSMGLRIGSVGYSTDMKTMDEDALATLTGIDTWIVDAAGHYSDTNPVHASIGELVELNARLKARRVILTHLPPSMDYRTLQNELPSYMEPAHDGMVLSY